MEVRQRIAFKAVIVNADGRVLILRETSTYKDGSNSGKFDFPGGRLEPGEAWQDGLRREVMEETGLEVEIGKPLFVGEWRPVIQGVQNQIIALFLVCALKSKDAKIVFDSEHDYAEWVTAESWHSLSVLDATAQVLETYFASVKSAKE